MDSYLLLALKGVRMAAYGLTMMVLVPFLLALGRDDREVGLFMTLTLVGDVILSSYITRVADRCGRRFMLGASSVCMLLSGVCFMFCTNYTILLVAAVAGVISPSGDEVGPFRAIEESSVAQITRSSNRSRLFAAQNFVGTLGLALGSFAGGYLVDVFTQKTGKAIDSYRVVFFGYTMCALISFALCAGLSSSVELPSARRSLEEEARVAFSHGADETSASAAEEAQQQEQALGHRSSTDLSAPSYAASSVGHGSTDPTISTRYPVASSDSSSFRSVSSEIARGGALITLLALFGIDSLAYGFMPNSWLVEYLMQTYNSKSIVLGAFFFVSTFISAMTSFPSAYLTDTIGSVAAISATKLGAGLFGGLVPVAHSLGGAMAMVWLRSLFDTMDVVPRQVFITNIVPEHHRTYVLGLINIVKTFARAAGPIFTGIFASKNLLSVCFVIMGSLEWVFAIAVYATYRSRGEYGDIQI